jgi:hypothetical protein
MTAPLPPLPRSFAITLDGSGGKAERAFIDLYTCACGHPFERHGPEGAAPPSKSKCVLCGCTRYIFQDEVP